MYMSESKCNPLTIRLISCRVWAHYIDRLPENEQFCMLWVFGVLFVCFYFILFFFLIVYIYSVIIFFSYSGAKCESDINECDSAPCQNGGVCRDRVGGFQCQCKPGFVGKNLTANTDLQE